MFHLRALSALFFIVFSLGMTVLQRIAHWALSLRGWKAVGSTPKDVKKYVIISAPHTSNWDFPIALVAALALGIRAKWVGKKEIFRFPFGGIMRALGGIAVDRSQRNQMVDYMANVLESAETLGLLIPPEGTRSKAAKWKTGFYYIANKAQTPIVCGFIDYAKKEVGVGLTFMPSGDIHSDIALIREFYAGIQGKYPDQTTPVEI